MFPSIIPVIMIIVLVYWIIWTHNLHSMRTKKRNHINLQCIRNAFRLSLFTLTPILLTTPAHASIFHGETLDMVADIMSWVVLVVAPAIGITVFWLLHIMPEKIAIKKQHPQAQAIHTLCLLSLFFGGILWPLAWLWTFSKPVMYKLAYGTDKVDHGHGKADHAEAAPDAVQPAEVERLRKRLAELEGKLAVVRSATEGTKA